MSTGALPATKLVGLRPHPLGINVLLERDVHDPLRPSDARQHQSLG